MLIKMNSWLRGTKKLVAKLVTKSKKHLPKTGKCLEMLIYKDILTF